MKQISLRNMMIIMLLAISGSIIAQPTWTIVNTGANHTILVEPTVVTIDGVSIVNGDYVGAFFDDNGTAVCGGYFIYTGAMNAMTAWGDDTSTGIKDGFSAGEAINWKVWRAADALVIDMIATYTATMPNQGFYATNGMSAIATMTGTAPALSLAATGVTTNLSCYGVCDGSIDLTVSGGTPPYAYTWSNGSSVEDLTNLCAGTYDVTVNDASGGSLIMPWAFTNTGANHTILVQSGTVTINGSPIEVGDYIGVFFLDSGNYVCGGYTLWTGGTSNAVTAWGDDTSTSDKDGFSSGESFNWKVWKAVDGAIVDMAATYTATFPSLGSYTTNGMSGIATMTGTYTPNPGGSVSTSFTITQPDSILIDYFSFNNTCNGANVGSIDLTVSGGTTPYTYLWSDGSTTEDLFNLYAGLYTVTVTDSNGCTLTQQVEITEPAAFSITAITNDVTCYGGNDGAIDITVTGGTPPLMYSWSNGATTEDLTGLSVGSFEITILDPNGCVSSPSFYTISSPAELLSSVVSTNPTCFGGFGSADLTVTGGVSPYTFLWSNGATTEDLINIPEDFYGVTITDANGCIATDFGDLIAPDVIFVAANITNILCNSGTTGAIDLTVTGGVSPYIFEWSNVATTEDVTGLSVGNYSVTVTDSNNCTSAGNYTLTEPAALSATYTLSDYSGYNISINGAADGTIDLTVTGGTPSYFYSWSNGMTSEDLSTLTAGTYLVTITDNNGCSFTETMTLTEPPSGPALAGTLSVTDVACLGGADGAIDLTVSGGISPYTYIWSEGSTSEDISGLVAGSYSVTVTDLNSNTVVLNATVNDGITVVVDLGADATICDGSSYTLDAGLFASYLWTSLAQTTQTINVTTAGTYSVTVTDANGCIGDDDFVLTINPVYNETDAATICDGDTYVLGTQTLTMAGVYTEVFQAANGCDSTVVFTLTVNPVYNETDAATICDGDTYIFGTQTLTMAGTYTEVFQTVNGCDSTVVLTLTVNPVYNEVDGASICDGDTYIFGTQTLTMAGTYIEVFQTGNGCDSTIVLTLTVNPVYNETDVATICDGDAFAFGTQTLTIAGVYTEVFQSADGCDSTVVLTLSVNPIYNETDAATICDGDAYTFGTQTLTIAGTYTEVFQSVNGCDSTVVLTLSVNPVYNETDAATICDGDTYAFGTQTLTIAGPYTEIFQSVNGCDSTVVLTLTVNPVYNETDAATICDGDTYAFGTQTLSVAGVYTEVFQTVNSCDSTVILTLSVNPIYNETDAATICDGDSYTFGTQTLTVAGVYTEVFQSVDGCDSTVVFTLTVNPLPLVDLGADVGVCEGGFYTLDAGVFNSYLWSTGETTMTIDVFTTGTYSVDVTDNNGCTGTDDFTFTVNPLPVVDLGPDITILQGSTATLDAGVFASYVWSTGATTQTIDVTTAGSYYVDVTDQYGCEGSDTITITLTAVQFDEQIIELIEGYSCISTYIDPFFPNVSDVFAPVQTNVILVKDEDGNPFWPAFGLNNIGDMIIGEGYQVHMLATQLLSIQGDQVIPELTPISLQLGWNIFGYLRTTPMSLETAVNSITSDIYIIKNSFGFIYWPAFMYNSIGNILPGQGYFAKMYNSNSFTYPANTSNAAKAIINNPINKHYKNVLTTSLNMTLGIPVNAWTNTPNIGDEVAVFSPSGNLVGATVFTGENIAITIWGNNTETNEFNGLKEGMNYIVKLWSNSEQTEQELVISSWAEGDGTYSINGISLAEKITKIENHGVSELYQNTPNPVRNITEIGFSIENECDVTISIFNLLGEKMEVINLNKLSSGKHIIDFDASDYAVGTYLYKIEADDFYSTRKMTIVD